MLVNYVAHHLRNITALLSVANLKEYLTQAVAALPEDSKLKPIIKLEILENKNLKEKDLKATLGKLKTIVKTYELSNRKPFQVTILEPIQNFFDKKNPFVPTKMFDTIRDQKEILKKKEKELSEAQKQIREDKEIPFPKVLANE